MPSRTIRINGKRHPGEPFSVDVPSDTKWLDLHDELLLDLDFEAIGTLHSLENLDLSGNDFHGVHVDMHKLEHCPLRRIDLSGNITLASSEPCVYDLSLGNFPFLELLDLYGNALTSLDLAPLVSSKNLRELDISWNHLRGIDTNHLDSCPGLEKLSLEANQLREIPTSICKLGKLESLKLGLNKLTSLPERFGLLEDLKRLELSNNQIPQLPSTFSALERLQVLKVANLPLRELPADLSNLAKILVLDASSFVQGVVQVALLPRMLGALQDIVYIDIVHDKLEAVPEQLRSCTNVRFIDLGSNEIEKMPRWLDEFQDLQVLGLNGFKGHAFPDVILSMNRLRHLKMVDASCPFPEELLDMPSLEMMAVSQDRIDDPVLKRLSDRSVRVYVPCFSHGHFGRAVGPLWEVETS